VPDVHIQLRGKVTEEDYFTLYKTTYTTVKKILPGIDFGSPTITVTHGGLAFAKAFLTYCQHNDCVPDYMNFTHYYRSTGAFKFKESFVEAKGFVEEIRGILRSLKLDSKMPLNLMEYTYGFGKNLICDSAVGAMFPLELTLQNRDLFSAFGYWGMTDYTTGFAGKRKQFGGGHGLLTALGGEKAKFYALKYMRSLGSACLQIKNGLVVCKKDDRIQLLLFYDIPAYDWADEYYPDRGLTFYRMYPERSVAAELTDLPREQILIRESVISYEMGSAYETWLAGGRDLLEADDDSIVRSWPVVYVHEEIAQGGQFKYLCVLKPFEMRLVEIY